MDFMNRGFRNNSPNSQNVDQTADHAPGGVSSGLKDKPSNSKFSGGNLTQAAKLTFLLLIVVLVVLALYSLLTFKGSASEAALVDKTKYQAVFLNGGQVYFGNVADLNKQYMQVNNVYYLRVNQQVQPDANAQNAQNDISLVKLGCELHGPQDRMVINREQVIFWENLKDDGQVAKAIAQYKEQFPNGQNCDEQAASQQNNNTSNIEADNGAGQTQPTQNPPAGQ